MTSAHLHLLLDSKLSRAIYWPLFFVNNSRRDSFSMSARLTGATSDKVIQQLLSVCLSVSVSVCMSVGLYETVVVVQVQTTPAAPPTRDGQEAADRGQ